MTVQVFCPFGCRGHLHRCERPRGFDCCCVCHIYGVQEEDKTAILFTKLYGTRFLIDASFKYKNSERRHLVDSAASTRWRHFPAAPRVSAKCMFLLL